MGTVYKSHKHALGNEDTCSDFRQVDKLALSSPEAIGGRSVVDLREAQLADSEIKLVLMRMEESNDKPSWEETATFTALLGGNCHIYCI